MSLVVIIPFYNEFKPLQRLLLRLSSMKLSSILCDGRFHNFKKINNSDKSTDGSRFLIHGFKNAKLIDCPPCNVEEKFTRLLHEASRDGYSSALLLGCDEYIVGDIEILTKSLESFEQKNPTIIKALFIDHTTDTKKDSQLIDRIFIMPDQIKANTHNEFYLIGNLKNRSGKKIEAHPKPIKGITIHHDNTIRTKERNELMKEYQNSRTKK